MDQNTLFRTKPYEKLTSPERIDELFRVTSTGKWLILVAVFLILVTALIWGLMGTVMIKVNGPGIINQPVEEIYSPVDGRIDSILVQVGESICKDQALLKIIPENALILTDIPDHRQPLQMNISPKNENKSGEKIHDLPDYLSETEGKKLIFSPFDGSIVEIRSNTGNFVRVSTPLLSLQRFVSDSIVPVIFFVDAGNIVRLNPGMEVRVEVTDSKGGGSFTGNVTYISHFPASFGRLMNVFHNEAQARELSDAPHYECKAVVIPSPGRGSDEINRNSGRICQVEVIIEKRKPFDLLF